LRRLLLDGEHPDDAALRHVILNTELLRSQCVLDALCIYAPTRLDGDILRSHDFLRIGMPWMRVGLLLPAFPCLGMKGAEIGHVLRSSDEIAGE